MQDVNHPEPAIDVMAKKKKIVLFIINLFARGKRTPFSYTERSDNI